MKLNKTIIISDILSILITFSLFIWIFIEMKCVAIVYDRILNNLFIKDFNPVQKITLSRNQCQEKNMYSLINYTFPGIREGCYNTKSHNIELGQCSTNNENFQNVEKIDKKNFTIWRNKILCAKYFEYDSSYYKLIDYNKTDCDKGYKACGTINKEATKERIRKILCIKSNLECPLNFIKITNDISQYNNSDDNNIYSFENGYYLITSNKNVSNGIITKIKIAEGEYPCYERGKYSNTSSQFPTIINENNFNCSSSNVDNYTDKDDSMKPGDDEEEKRLIEAGFDIRFIKFDYLPKVTVLADNDLDYSYSMLPNLTNWSQDMFSNNFYLFYQNTFIIKEECDKFTAFESNIKKLKNVQAIRVVFALFHILLYVMLFSILGLIKVILSWRHSMLFGIKIILSFIIFGVNFGLIFVSKNYLSNLDNFKDNLEICLDEVAKAILRNHNIKNIIDDLKVYYDKEQIIWYCYLFFNFIEACRLVHKIYLRCKNTYRRNIANNDIGAENLKSIFEKVRKELEHTEKNKDQ